MSKDIEEYLIKQTSIAPFDGGGEREYIATCDLSELFDGDAKKTFSMAFAFGGKQTLESASQFAKERLADRLIESEYGAEISERFSDQKYRREHGARGDELHQFLRNRAIMMQVGHGLFHEVFIDLRDVGIPEPINVTLTREDQKNQNAHECTKDLAKRIITDPKFPNRDRILRRVWKSKLDGLPAVAINGDDVQITATAGDTGGLSADELRLVVDACVRSVKRNPIEMAVPDRDRRVYYWFLDENGQKAKFLSIETEDTDSAAATLLVGLLVSRYDEVCGYILDKILRGKLQ